MGLVLGWCAQRLLYGCRAVGRGLTEVLCILVEFFCGSILGFKVCPQSLSRLSGAVFWDIGFVGFSLALEAMRAPLVPTYIRRHFRDVKCTFRWQNWVRCVANLRLKIALTKVLFSHYTSCTQLLPGLVALKAKLLRWLIHLLFPTGLPFCFIWSHVHSLCLNSIICWFNINIWCSNHNPNDSNWQFRYWFEPTLLVENSILWPSFAIFHFIFIVKLLH